MRQMHKDFQLGAKRFQRPFLVAQLLLTAAILALVPGNAAKLAAMLLVWAAGFGRLTRAELILMIGTNAIFVAMDIATLHRGAFRFTAPDLLGLPYYEVLLFALPFSLIQDYRLLFLASGIVLAIGIGFFHERRDIAFVGYMIAMGAVMEYAGVWSGQWRYDGPTFGGVPLWFAPMWGGVGLFTHRLGLPLLRILRTG